MTDPGILDILGTLAMIDEGELSWNIRCAWYAWLVNSVQCSLSSPWLMSWSRNFRYSWYPCHYWL